MIGMLTIAIELWSIMARRTEKPRSAFGFMVCENYHSSSYKFPASTPLWFVEVSLLGKRRYWPVTKRPIPASSLPA